MKTPLSLCFFTKKRKNTKQGVDFLGCICYNYYKFVNKCNFDVIITPKNLEVITMQRSKKLASVLLSVTMLSGACVAGSSTTAHASGTGAGLAEWALNAYYSGWSYVYGGATPGTVDCSGLIYSYCGGNARGGDSQLYASSESGYISNGIPRVHGLGLHMDGHVGVYIGDGMAVDARNDDEDVCYDTLDYMGWTQWYKVGAIDYIENGWEQFNGDYYYYENGEYIVDTSRTIDGTTYYFDSKGRSSSTPSDPSSSSSSSSSGSSNSDNSSSDSSSDNSSDIVSEAKEEEKEETPKEPALYRNGDEDEEIKKIQERLKELGYYNGEVTGKFDDATEAAYIQFQQAAGVAVDGISGTDRDVLYSEDCPTYADAQALLAEQSPIYTLGDQSNAVLTIQNRLSILGFFNEIATGYYGDTTAQAVEAFQLANNLEATGIVDQETYQAMFSATALSNNGYALTTAADYSGPYVMPATGSSQFILQNTQNQDYAHSAAVVASAANKVTKKALSSTSADTPTLISAVVKRNLNVGLWFMVVLALISVFGGAFIIKRMKTAKKARRARARSRKSYTRVKTEARYW